MRHASAGRGGAGRDCPGAPPGGLGVPNARDTLALPEAGRGVPCHPLHRRASSTSPPAIGGDRVASAGRCGAVRACCAGPSRVVEALRQGRARAAQAAHVPRAAAPPTTRWHGPAGADEQPASAGLAKQSDQLYDPGRRGVVSIQLRGSRDPIREREIAALGGDQVALPAAAHGPMERVARFGDERTLCASTFRKFFVVVFSDAESSFKGIHTPAYP